MNVSVIIATYGETKWADLGYERARPSALEQGAFSVAQRHEHDATLSAVRNAAAAEDVRGDWLLYLDADDELAPGYLDAMRAELHYRNLWRTGDLRDNPILLVPRVQYVHPDGREEEPVFPNRHAPMDVMNHCVIGTLVPRRLFLQVGGFPEGLACYEDWALFLACVRAGATLVDVPDAVYRAHVRPESRNQQALRVRAVAYAKIRRQHLSESRRREVA